MYTLFTCDQGRKTAHKGSAFSPPIPFLGILLFSERWNYEACMIITCVHTELGLSSLVFSHLPNILFTTGGHRLHAGVRVVSGIRLSHGMISAMHVIRKLLGGLAAHPDIARMLLLQLSIMWSVSCHRIIKWSYMQNKSYRELNCCSHRINLVWKKPSSPTTVFATATLRLIWALYSMVWSETKNAFTHQFH